MDNAYDTLNWNGNLYDGFITTKVGS